MNIATEITTNNTKEEVINMLGVTNSEATFSDERVDEIDQDWCEGETTVFFTDGSSIIIEGCEVRAGMAKKTETREELEALMDWDLSQRYYK